MGEGVGVLPGWREYHSFRFPPGVFTQVLGGEVRVFSVALRGGRCEGLPGEMGCRGRRGKEDAALQHLAWQVIALQGVFV